MRHVTPKQLHDALESLSYELADQPPVAEAGAVSKDGLAGGGLRLDDLRAEFLRETRRMGEVATQAVTVGNERTLQVVEKAVRRSAELAAQRAQVAEERYNELEEKVTMLMQRVASVASVPLDPSASVFVPSGDCVGEKGARTEASVCGEPVTSMTVRGEGVVHTEKQMPTKA